MNAPVQIVIAFLALLVSAQTRVRVIGHPVPVLWLIAAALVLALAVAVLLLLRSLARAGFWSSPHPRTVA